MTFQNTSKALECTPVKKPNIFARQLRANKADIKGLLDLLGECGFAIKLEIDCTGKVKELWFSRDKSGGECAVILLMGPSDWFICTGKNSFDVMHDDEFWNEYVPVLTEEPS